MSKAADLSNGKAVLVRMSPAQHAACKKLADKAGVSMAKYLLRSVDRAAKIPASKRRPGPGGDTSGAA